MRALFLQDDTHLPPMGYWQHSDRTTCLIGEPEVVRVLEHHFGLDLAPLYEDDDDDGGGAVQAILRYLFDEALRLRPSPPSCSRPPGLIWPHSVRHTIGCGSRSR